MRLLRHISNCCAVSSTELQKLTAILAGQQIQAVPAPEGPATPTEATVALFKNEAARLLGGAARSREGLCFSVDAA